MVPGDEAQTASGLIVRRGPAVGRAGGRVTIALQFSVVHGLIWAALREDVPSVVRLEAHRLSHRAPPRR